MASIKDITEANYSTKWNKGQQGAIIKDKGVLYFVEVNEKGYVESWGDGGRYQYEKNEKVAGGFIAYLITHQTGSKKEVLFKSYFHGQKELWYKSNPDTPFDDMTCEQKFNKFKKEHIETERKERDNNYLFDFVEDSYKCTNLASEYLDFIGIQMYEQEPSQPSSSHPAKEERGTLGSSMKTEQEEKGEYKNLCKGIKYEGKLVDAIYGLVHRGYIKRIENDCGECKGLKFEEDNIYLVYLIYRIYKGLKRNYDVLTCIDNGERAPIGSIENLFGLKNLKQLCCNYCKNIDRFKNNEICNGIDASIDGLPIDK